MLLKSKFWKNPTKRRSRLLLGRQGRQVPRGVDLYAPENIEVVSFEGGIVAEIGHVGAVLNSEKIDGSCPLYIQKLKNKKSQYAPF